MLLQSNMNNNVKHWKGSLIVQTHTQFPIVFTKGTSFSKALRSNSSWVNNERKQNYLYWFWGNFIDSKVSEIQLYFFMGKDNYSIADAKTLF